MNLHALRRRITGHMLWEYSDLGVIALGVFVVFLGLGTVWPVLTIYMQKHGASMADIGVTTAAYMAANFLFQVPMGWVSDRLGRKLPLLGGLAVHGLVSVLYLVVQDSTGFTMLRFVEGIGASAMMPAARAHLMDSIPPDRRGQAFGLLSSAFSGSILIGPGIGGLMASFIGMESPFWFGLVSSIVAGAFLMLKVRDRRHSQADAERELAAARGVSSEQVQWRALIPVFTGAMSGGLVGGFFNVIWNIWLHDLGASLDVIGFSYTLFALPLIFVGPWAGRLADHRSRVLLLLVPSLLAAGIYLSYGFITSVPVILLLGVIEGIGIGIIGPVADSYMSDVLPGSRRGRLQGLVSASSTAVSFVSALICGPLYAAGPFWLFLLLGSVMAGMAITGSLFMLPVERRLRGPLERPAGRGPRAELGEIAPVA